MATRSTIVIEIPASKNGKTYQFKTPHYKYETPAVTIPENARYAVIYCHWDGYPDGLGADLAEIENGKYYYGDFDTVMNMIIAGGDSSYLGQPYHAWRNEEWESVQPRFTETLPPVTEEYQYLFTEEGNWEYRNYEDTNFTCLTNKGTL